MERGGYNLDTRKRKLNFRAMKVRQTFVNTYSFQQSVKEELVFKQTPKVRYLLNCLRTESHAGLGAKDAIEIGISHFHSVAS